MQRPSTQREDGASAVEFALVVPLVCCLLFGMITLGFAYNDHLAISNSVREGARYGSTIDYTAAGWSTSVRDRVKQVYFNNGSTITNNQICVKLVNGSGAIGTSWSGGSCGDEPPTPTLSPGRCAVKVWTMKNHDIDLLIFPSLDLNIGAKSVSHYGRTVTPGCPAE